MNTLHMKPLLVTVTHILPSRTINISGIYYGKSRQISLKDIIVRFSSLNPDGRTQGWTGHLEDKKTCFCFLPISQKSSSYIQKLTLTVHENS